MTNSFADLLRQRAEAQDAYAAGDASVRRALARPPLTGGDTPRPEDGDARGRQKAAFLAEVRRRARGARRYDPLDVSQDELDAMPDEEKFAWLDDVIARERELAREADEEAWAEQQTTIDPEEGHQ